MRRSRARLGVFALASAVTSLVLLALPSLASAAPSTLRKGPFLQDLASDGVSIRLELDPPGRAEVEVEGPAAAAGEIRRVRSQTPDRPSALQTFHVGGLQPKTAYRYRVILFDGAKEIRPGAGADASASEGTFSTAPQPAGDPAPISFIVYGDNRTDHAAHAQVVRAMTEAAAKGSADFLMHTGDFVEDGSNEIQWQRFFEIERPLLKDHCLFAAVGNHELTDSTGEAFLRYFGAPSEHSGQPERDRRRFARSVRWGALRILFLNAMDTFTSSEERKWLDAELARTDAESGVTFRFVVLHHGPYCSGPHGNNARLWNAGVVDMLRDHRIDLVWSGHDHLFERGEAKGLKYIVSGGGGAPLYPVRKRLATSRAAESAHHFVEVQVQGQRFDMIARRVDGSVLDRCGFSKGGAWDCDKASAPLASASVVAKDTMPPTSSSRCGCGVPSAPVMTGELAMTSLALAAFLVRRRNVSRRARCRPTRADRATRALGTDR